MSAPTSGSAGDSPTPGFYPDPSIPGYIRYWNGAAWVPGTSRPAPAEGEAMPAPPPGVATAAPSPAPAPSPVEETGPVFLDEEAGDGTGVPAGGESGEDGPADDRAAGSWDDPARRPGTGPEPASSWQADASRQSGFGGEADRRVSWGSAEQPQSQAQSGAASWGAVPAQRDERSGGRAAGPGSGEAPATSSTTTPGPRKPEGPADGTVTIRAVKPGGRGDGDAVDQGTTAIRAVRPNPGGTAGASGADGAAGAAKGNETMAIRVAQGGATGQSAPPGTTDPQPLPSVGTPQGRPQQNPGQQQGGQAPAVSSASSGFPPQGGAAAGAPGDDGVIPWKPPSADVFFAAAQAAQGHPAGLGRRFAARLIDTLVVGAAAAAVAVPLWGTVTDHIDAKVEAAKQSGREVTVYLLDGTTLPILGAVLAVLLIGGGLYEALPTVKWGRTLGKKLCKVRVLDIESHDTPGFGAAIKRWLVYGVLGVLAVGVVNVVWCLFDRPWRQCWHDKAARTFVAAD
ncbi:RDD family protein [Streptomyces halobius]|uniref:RDD family protein n=1 Tax=Streptomyces halobius TaxID=2879846 RepID=A0ABY4MEL9_9ACTN|nr:RDD family protein [Streptomyces halobius]UQA95189.1 RDD family protein [Streptomyces halobius]